MDMPGLGLLGVRQDAFPVETEPVEEPIVLDVVDLNARGGHDHEARCVLPGLIREAPQIAVELGLDVAQPDPVGEGDRRAAESPALDEIGQAAAVR